MRVLLKQLIFLTFEDVYGFRITQCVSLYFNILII